MKRLTYKTQILILIISLALFSFVGSSFSQSTEAKAPGDVETQKITTYYPSPKGRYQMIRLDPRSDIAINAQCEEVGENRVGLLSYSTNDIQILYCNGNTTTLPYPSWQSFAGAETFWTLDDSVDPEVLYPNDLNWNVGIGTDTPNARLQVDGAISRGGTTLQGDNFQTHINLGIDSTTGLSGGDYSYCTISGGFQNAAGGNYSTVSGGRENTALHHYSTVAGGYQNEANGQYSTVAGGRNNVAGDAFDPPNTAMGKYSTVLGGQNNNASGEYSVVAGGLQNTASGDYSVVSGGENNIASGDYSTVSGGRSNTASGIYSWAGGRRAKANDDGSFVWADSNDVADCVSNGNNTFNICASGGFYFGTTDATSTRRDLNWDVAEVMDVLASEDIQEAELVCIADNNAIIKSSQPYDEGLIGVISGDRTATVHLGNTTSNKEGIERFPVALVGQAYVKVNNHNGAIDLGSPITSSSTPGIGMKATKVGKIIGYALEKEDFQDSETAEILVFINLGYYLPEEAIEKISKLIGE
ncbi:MAG: hypothetical protein ABH954_03625 [Candidatus Omnitrophota bacterium]